MYPAEILAERAHLRELLRECKAVAEMVGD
jgi:hypothetical protein